MRVMSLALCMGVILSLTLGASGTRAEESGPRLLTGAQLDQISAGVDLVIAEAEAIAVGDVVRVGTFTSAYSQPTHLVTVNTAHASAFAAGTGPDATAETETFTFASGDISDQIEGGADGGAPDKFTFSYSFSFAYGISLPR